MEQHFSRTAQKPSTEGKTAAEYTYEMLKYHQSQYPDKPPSAFETWIGNSALAVLPQNRLGSATGLTIGQIIGGTLAGTIIGHKLFDGSKIEKAPTGLGWLKGIVKNYDPKAIGGRDKLIRQAAIAVFSLGGLLGVKVASDWVYSGAVEKAKDPHYIEDYLTRVSHHEGETWGWLSAISSIWGSASGTWLLPIPGVNYAMGMMSRILTMQNRNSTMPWLNEFTSGATTASYLRLKEGSHYLCEYAAGNPAQEPTNIEFLAYTILGPLFKDQLTAEHIKQFTDTVQAVRAPFWQEGGIPKDRRKEAVATMKEVFTGAGLEVLLIDMGLNPASIAFDNANGLIGKIGDIGQKDNIKKEQEAFWEALQNRLPKYVAAGEISQERADWVIAGIEAVKHGKPAPALPAQEIIRETSPEILSKENGAAPKEIIANNDNHLPRNERFAANPNIGLGAKFRKNTIKHLVETATELPSDWRDLALKQKQSMDAPMAIE